LEVTSRREPAPGGPKPAATPPADRTCPEEVFRGERKGGKGAKRPGLQAPKRKWGFSANGPPDAACEDRTRGSVGRRERKGHAGARGEERPRSSGSVGGRMHHRVTPGTDGTPAPGVAGVDHPLRCAAIFCIDGPGARA